MTSIASLPIASMAQSDRSSWPDLIHGCPVEFC
jgi:hypothetical protein